MGFYYQKQGVCQGGDRDKTPYSVNQTLYLTPDTKTIRERNMYSALIPAGTEFLVFSSEERKKQIFRQVTGLLNVGGYENKRVLLRVSTDEQDLTRQNEIIENARKTGFYVARCL